MMFDFSKIQNSDNEAFLRIIELQEQQIEALSKIIEEYKKITLEQKKGMKPSLN